MHGPQIGSSGESILTDITGIPGGLTDLWLLFITLGGGGALALAWQLQSTTPLAVYGFAAIFWTNITKALAVLGLLGTAATIPLIAGFIAIAIGALVLIFIAAVIGMFGV